MWYTQHALGLPIHLSLLTTHDYDNLLIFLMKVSHNVRVKES